MPFDPAALPKTRAAAIDAYVAFIQECEQVAQSIAYERAIEAGLSEEAAIDHAARARATGTDYAQRHLGLADLFYLVVFLLKREDVNRDWLFDRCREVQALNADTLDLWARYHYKSTIITFALTIQEILANPEETFCIFSDINKVARPFLAQIKREFEENGDLKRLYSDVLWQNPEKESPKWSETDGIIVRRKGNPKEATLEAYGLIDGMPTGRHFGRRIYDDLVTINTVNSPEMMKKVSDRLALSHALGVEDGGVARYIGTRYHGLDAYQGLIDSKTVWVRTYPATADGTEDGPPVLLTAPALAKVRASMGPFTFAAQMLQDPAADKAVGFREEWLRFWPARSSANLNVYILVDPSSGKKGKGPAGNDYTSMWVVGAAADKHAYALDHLRERLSLTQRASALFDLVRTWGCLACGYEEYGLQADIEYMHAEMARLTYQFTIVPLGGRLAKADRIRRLIPEFEAGRILLPDGLIRINRDRQSYAPIRRFIEDEYLRFPVATHDDGLDSLARFFDPDLGVIYPSATMSAVGQEGPPRLPLHVLNKARLARQPVDWRAG